MVWNLIRIYCVEKKINIYWILINQFVHVVVENLKLFILVNGVLILKIVDIIHMKLSGCDYEYDGLHPVYWV